MPHRNRTLTAGVLGLVFATFSSAGALVASDAEAQQPTAPRQPAAQPAPAPAGDDALVDEEDTGGAPMPAPSPTQPPASKGIPGMLPIGPEGGDAGAPARAAGTSAPQLDPERDAEALERQGREGAEASDSRGVRANPNGQFARGRKEVFSEDWWSHLRPAFEIHGYYRLRAELFHKFALGRLDAPGSSFWPQPPDQDYIDTKGDPRSVRLCGDNPLATEPCNATTQAGANMRFRVMPELHVSDNVRIVSQIDILDNLVLGSTSNAANNQPSAGGGYSAIGGGGYGGPGGSAGTVNAPSAGINSLSDSVSVKRVWGEYITPIGQLRFGRMPHHWGLGIFANAGDGLDSDYQSTIDRILFVSGLKKYDLYFGASWDFVNEGATSQSLSGAGTGRGINGQGEGQPYDLAQLDDVAQYTAFVMHKVDPEIQKLDLAKGKAVVNGGVYALYRTQYIANDETSDDSSASLGQSSENVTRGYVRRNLRTFTPDAHVQFLFDKFRFEFESVFVLGSLENTSSAGGSGTNFQNTANPGDDGFKVRQFGMAGELEMRFMDDKLKAEFGFGYASGDDDVDGLVPQGSGIEPQRTADRTYSTYRFHPDYRQDLIFYRNISGRVQGSYYFRPSIQYDFQRDKNGQRLGGNAAAIWSRASEFVQAPGNKRDLGVELNFSLYYQSKDGARNDNLERAGGFYTALQYGVFFPLGGLDYLPGEVEEYQNLTNLDDDALNTKTAQTLRWFLGISY